MAQPGHKQRVAHRFAEIMEELRQDDPEAAHAIAAHVRELNKDAYKTRQRLRDAEGRPRTMSTPAPDYQDGKRIPGVFADEWHDRNRQHKEQNS